MSKNLFGILGILVFIKLITLCVSLYVNGREKELEQFTWDEMNRYNNDGLYIMNEIKDLARSNRSEIPENIIPNYNSDDINNGYRFQDITTYYNHLLVSVPELNLTSLPLKKSFPDSLAEIGLSNFATEKIENLFDSRKWWERRIPRKIKGIINRIDETNDVITINIVALDVYNDFSERESLEIGTNNSLFLIKSLPILRIPGSRYLKIKFTNLKTGEHAIYDCN